MTIERFLGCAESAVLISGKPIRLQNEQPACDKRVTCKLGIYQLCQDKTEIAHSACSWQKPASWGFMWDIRHLAFHYLLIVVDGRHNGHMAALV